MPKRELDVNLAKLLVQVGAIQSALDIYNHLQMWEEIVACYNYLKLRHKARNPRIRTQFFFFFSFNEFYTFRQLKLYAPKCPNEKPFSCGVCWATRPTMSIVTKKLGNFPTVRALERKNIGLCTSFKESRCVIKVSVMLRRFSS